MLAILLLFTIASFLAACFILISYIRWNYGTLEKLGIPVVKPHMFLGSTPNPDSEIQHEVDYEWFKKYGMVFGVYEGRIPKIFVCDPELVRQIFIKDFDKFVNHSFEQLNTGSDILVTEFMDFLQDEKWKVVRSAFSPVFTSSKLKKMSHQMIGVAQDFTTRIKNDVIKTDSRTIEDFNLYQAVFLMLIELVAECTLHIKVENATDPNNDFAKALRALFDDPTPAILKKFLPVFPFLKKFKPSKTVDFTIKFFSQVFNSVIEQRQKSGTRNNDDFVDTVMDLLEKVKTPEFQRLNISRNTILAQAVEFYLAGQDSMSMAINMVAFYMSRQPEVEKKLYEEVDAYFQRHDGKISYETLNELVYLNACLQESLRLHPTFSRTDRICTEDVEYRGVKFTKGVVVVVPLWPYNRNPKYFPDPERFDPERFMPYNKDKLDPIAMGTFGHGPRMCIGMRFANEGMVVVMLHLLKMFRFTTKPETKVSYAPGINSIAYSGGTPVNISLR